MKLNKAVLKGFKRFHLNNIQTLEYTPTATDQIILGTNGSGKSSFVHLLVALIPETKSFIKGGSAEFDFSHKNSQYLLTSKYPHDAGHHSFIKDGEELNPGATQKAQLELLVTEFGLTAGVIDILAGRVRFSQMNTNERREWLMVISGTDFGYALEAHEKIAKITRDFKGVLAQADEVAAGHQKDLMRLEAEYEEGEKQVAQIEEELRLLSLEKTKDITSVYEVTARLMKVQQTITELSNAILTATNNPDGETSLYSRAVLEDHLYDLAQLISAGNQSVQQYADDIDSLPRILEATDDDVALTEDDLRVELHRLQKDRQNARDRVLVYQTEVANAGQVADVACSLQTPLTELMQAIPLNDDGRYSRDGYRELKAQYDSLNEALRRNSNDRGKLEGHLQQAKHVDTVDCPHCKLGFRPGINDAVMADKQQALDQLVVAHEHMTRQAEEMKAQLEEYKGYSEQIAQFKNMHNGYLACKPFWDRVVEENLVYASPMSVPVQLRRFITDMRAWEQVQLFTAQFNNTQFKLDTLLAAGGTGYIIQRRAELEEKLHEAQTSVFENKARQTRLQSVLRRITMLETQREALISLIGQYDSLRAQLVEGLRQESIGDVMTKHYEHIGKLRWGVNQYKVTAGMVELLAKQRDEAAQKYASYKLLTQALSPNEGIVAEAVKEFIAYFTGLLNDHIGRVWNYGMEVQALVEVDTKLNWKFPLYLKGSDQLVPDIKLGSSGQVSMVDFAFKLVIMDLLEIQDFPLVIDEFGKDFDPEHRERLVRYIKSLLEQGQFSQMFMVSHYSSVYGSFNQAQYLVLDDRNITVPEVYNQHCIMH